MKACPACGADQRESARFCDNCGTSQQVAPPTDDIRWGVFHRWAGRWALAQWYAPSADEAINNLNQPTRGWPRGDDPYGNVATSSQAYLGHVRTSQAHNSLTIIEWYLVNWSADDGGKWVRGDVAPIPDGGSIILTSLE